MNDRNYTALPAAYSENPASAEKELNQLIKQYIPVIKAKAVKMSQYCPSAESDDLFSDGMLGLLKAIRCYKSDRGASFSTFANLCISSAMKTAASKAIRSSPLSKDEDFDMELIEDSSATAEEALIDKEQDTEFYKRLSDMLTERELSVLKMYLRRMTYQQMAQQLSISEKSVDNALQRAKQKLRRNLGK